MSDTLRVGVAGLGTVGAAVLRLLARQADALERQCGRRIAVTGVCVRDRGKARPADLAGLTWFDDASALAVYDGIDVLVEVIGGEEGAARKAVEAALAAGKPVVTANKALLARHGLAIASAAERAGVSVGFEAAVAGGLPVIKTLREALAGNMISRVYGILNGTCNYILSRMESDGLPFEACLAEAQRLGYAEADPSFDIGGHDTAHKLAILASLAFGTALDVDAIHVEGIEAIRLADLKSADQLGYRVKLLGVAQRVANGIEQRVHPTMVPKSSAIAQTMGVTNAVTIDADAVHELTLAGPGAGGEATASAIVADLADIARDRDRSRPMFGRPVAALERLEPVPLQRHEGGYYVRLSVHDRPGAAAAIATRMAEKKISLESIVQHRPLDRLDRHAEPSVDVPVVLITYATTEAAIREALEAVVEDGFIAEKPQVIRIERE